MERGKVRETIWFRQGASDGRAYKLLPPHDPLPSHSEEEKKGKFSAGQTGF